MPGVWTLLAQNKEQDWTCLQVGQSNDISSEIISDIKCISGDIKTIECRNYINQFGKVVEGYEYNVYLTPREQIYKKIGKEYSNYIFVCICCGEKFRNNKKAIEKYVAWQFEALFWRNGRPFINENVNVNKPKDIDKDIDPDIKTSVENMVKWYYKQK